MTPGRPALYKRKFIVDCKLQLTLLVYTGIVILLTMALVKLTSYAAVLDEVEGSSGWLDHRAQVFLIIVFFLSLLLFANVILSHRIAGPIHRLKAHMDDMIAGRHNGPIKLRKGDFFLGLVDRYNRLIQSFTETSTTKPSDPPRHD